MSIIDAFNAQLIKFVSEFEKKIIINYPDYQRDVKIYKLGLKTLLITNNIIAIDNFNKYVFPYRKIIRNKDENYFRNNSDQLINDGTDLANEHHISDDDRKQYILDVLKVKVIWDTLNDNNKTIIWEYLNVLIKLCKLWNKNKS
jgi:hypothetical protein